MERKRLFPLFLMISFATGACSEESTSDDDGSMGGESGSEGDGGTGGMPMTGLPPTGLLDCSGVDVSDAVEVSGDITEDTTWEGTVYVSGSVDTESGATVTIEPGTDVVVAVDASIEFGWNSNAATVNAAGTSDAPIRFCGETSEAGYWDKIIVGQNVTSNSVFRHVLISDAGGSDTAFSLSTGITVDNVQVRNSGGDGVWASDFEEDSSDLTVEGSANAAAVLFGSGAITHFPLGGDLVENGEPLARIRFSDVDVDTAYHDLGIPYLQEESVDVEQGAEVVFDAGVEVQFDADTSLEVGWNGNDAAIATNGTEDDPVVFRGKEDLAGFWHGIYIRQNVLTNSQMSSTEIWHAGGEDNSALSVESPITLENVTLNTNETGMWMSGSGVADDSTNLTITGTEGAPLVLQPNALVSVVEGGDYTGNADDRIEVEGGDYTEDGTVPNVGVPYYLRGSVDTETDSVLTLTPGTEFVMTADTSLEIGWNGNEATFIAEGTENAPIVFTASDETAGHWAGLIIGSSVLSSSSLDYVEVHYAGGSSTTANLLLYSPISVTNSTFAHSAGWGILKEESDTTDYEADNTFTDNASGTVSNL